MRKGAQVAVVETAEGPLAVVNTHLSANRDGDWSATRARLVFQDEVPLPGGRRGHLSDHYGIEAVLTLATSSAGPRPQRPQRPPRP